MNCDEIQRLYDAWLDSELDARTTVEVEQHLESCAECAREFASRKALDTPIMARLRQRQETSALWRAIEEQVLSSPKNAPAPRPSASRGIRPRWASLSQYLRTALRPSPAAWAGLAAVWVVILSLHGAAREPAAPPGAAAPTPSAAEMRMALWQKRLLMADFAESVASSKAGEGEPVPPGPRTDSSAIQPSVLERFMI
jgi:anti-sigma factor RsiW